MARRWLTELGIKIWRSNPAKNQLSHSTFTFNVQHPTYTHLTSNWSSQQPWLWHSTSNLEITFQCPHVYTTLNWRNLSFFRFQVWIFQRHGKTRPQTTFEFDHVSIFKTNMVMERFESVYFVHAALSVEPPKLKSLRNVEFVLRTAYYVRQKESNVTIVLCLTSGKYRGRPGLWVSYVKGSLKIVGSWLVISPFQEVFLFLF